MTTRCHSVFSRRSPVVLSFQESEVASRKFAIGRPSWVRRISGSAPRLPTRITLLTLPAMIFSPPQLSPLHARPPRCLAGGAGHFQHPPCSTNLATLCRIAPSHQPAAKTVAAFHTPFVHRTICSSFVHRKPATAEKPAFRAFAHRA